MPDKHFLRDAMNTQKPLPESIKRWPRSAILAPLLLLLSACDPMASADYILVNNTSQDLNVELKYDYGSVDLSLVGSQETKTIGSDASIGFVEIKRSLASIKIRSASSNQLLFQQIPIEADKWASQKVGLHDMAYTLTISDEDLSPLAE